MYPNLQHTGQARATNPYGQPAYGQLAAQPAWVPPAPPLRAPETLWQDPQFGVADRPGEMPFAWARQNKRTSRPWRLVTFGLVAAFSGGVFARPYVEAWALDVVSAARVGVGTRFGTVPAFLQRSASAADVPGEVATNPTAREPVAAPAEVVVSPSVAEPPAVPPPSEPAARAPQPEVAPVVAAEPVAAAPAAAIAPPVERTRSRHHRHSSRVSREVALSPAAEKPAPNSEPEAPPPKRAAAPEPEPEPAPVVSSDPLDRLMAKAVRSTGADAAVDRMVRKGARAPKVAAAETVDAPEAPPRAVASDKPALTRQQIVDTMKSLQPQVAECAAELPQSAKADLTVTVAPDGSVSSVKLAGPLFATRSGGCVVRAVKAASFPASQGMQFPYRMTVSR